MKIMLSALFLLLVTGCASFKDDPNLWLENVESGDALSWVRARNEKTVAKLEGRADYRGIETEIHKILLARDRIPQPVYRGGYVYNFWQDEKSVRGIWRRTTLSSFRQKSPAWDVLLDLDGLAREEGENWVYKGVQCLPPRYERCMVQLSRGGKDAVVSREFDVPSRRFVAGGFEVPEAKSELSWLDRDTLLVGTDFGPGSLTRAGYPRIVKKWNRGTPLAAAAAVFEVPEDDVAASAETYFRADGEAVLLERQKTFFEQEYWLYDPRSGARTLLPVALDAHVVEVFRGRVFLLLRSDWRGLPAGALIALSLARPSAEPELVFAPGDRSAVTGAKATRDALYLSVIENVKGRIIEITYPRASGNSSRQAEQERRVTAHARPLPASGYNAVSIASADPFSGVLLTFYESLLTPQTLHLVRPGAPPAALKRAPGRFDPRGLSVEQLEAVSRDGTRVPYFLVRNQARSIGLGASPTLLYGYGGFEIPMLPAYNPVMGKIWLERGGVYALANIRGGGEFGPRWHQAALKANRQKAFDDFAAIAEDLIARKITSPEKLGIMGGSNGGLLMGATFTQRPELFGAVVCQVPLLDMLRYNKLLAGHSWEGEYGSPDNPETGPALRRYSPYQNVRPGVRYPEILFITSTKDDRVHPGHARKMVARLESLGQSVYYYENIEGGHGAAANLEQKVRMRSLEYAYLWMKLGVL